MHLTLSMTTSFQCSLDRCFWFWHRHIRETVVILEEGNLPCPHCHMCDMLVLWRSLNEMHRYTVQCKKGAERKRHRLETKEERVVTSRAFISYGIPLDMVTSFRYLGMVNLSADNDWTAVVRNLAREREV